MKAETDDLAIRLLLGKLSEDERRTVEERFLSDSEFFEQILSVEDALIDRYLSGALDKEDRVAAELLFQSSDAQQQNLEFTRNLLTLLRASATSARVSRVSQSEPAQPPQRNEAKLPKGIVEAIALPGSTALSRVGRQVHLWGWAVAALIGVVLVSVILDMRHKERLFEAQRMSIMRNAGDAEANLREQTVRGAALANELETERKRRQMAEDLLAKLRVVPPDGTASVILQPTTMERGGASKVVRLKISTGRVRVQLVVGEDRPYESYRVLISTFDNHSVWNSDSISPNQIISGKLSVTLSAKLFRYEDYKIELRGSSVNGDSTHLADYLLMVRR
jgi:hypothetical protein